MTLREGGGGLLKPSESVIWMEGGWSNRHITIIVAEKAKFTVYFTFTVHVEVV